MEKIKLKFRSIEIFTSAAVVWGTLLFVLLLFFARWPYWWELTVPEMSPMTWMESLLLFIIAITAGLAAMLCHLKSDKISFRLWSTFSIGFLYLTLDERFAIHERIRDNLLAPMRIKLPLFFWTRYGDFILLVFLVAGLAFSFKMVNILKHRKISYILFVTGLLFAAAAVLLDSFEFTGYSLEVQRWEQFLEEILEIISMLFFFNAVFLRFTSYLKELVKAN